MLTAALLGVLTFISSLVLSPLSYTLRSSNLDKTSPILYYALYVHGSFANFIASALTVGSCYYWYTIMYALATEFEVCGLAFTSLMDQDDKISGNVLRNVNSNIDDFKDVIRSYQNLLR